jgi:2'-5' RNA ligase
VAETARTFIAIEMPPAVHDFLARCQGRLRQAGGGVRWVRPDLIHLTLVFLGDVPLDLKGDLRLAVEDAAAGCGPLDLVPAGAGRFPPRGMPRVVWIGVEEPTGRLLQLQQDLARATEAFAEKQEDRGYHPHLTLGRTRGGNLRPLDNAVRAMAAERGPAMRADEVVIFRSDLAPEGPTYTPLARVPLAGDKGEGG